jgi:hypothetical protein
MTSVLNFLNSIFHWDADQGVFSKVLSVLLALFGIFCLGWLIVASYGIGNTLLAQAHTAGHGGSETFFATLFFAAAAFWGWINFTDRIPFKVNDMVWIIGVLVLIVLGVNANTGFFGHVY